MRSAYLNKGLIPGEGLVSKRGMVVPTDRWSCIEWLFDGPNNSMKFWFDGTEDTKMRVDGTEVPLWKAPPAFSWVEIGFLHHQSGSPGGNEMYYDDFAIADRRIGCNEGAP